MVDALRRNVARGTRDVGLFELGLVVALDGPQGSAPTEDVGIRPSDETLAAIRAAVPPQPRHVGLLLAGDRVRAGWWGAGRPADVADVVEVARTVGEALGLRARGVGGCRAALPPRPLRPRRRWPTAPSSATSASCTPRSWRRSGCRRAPWAASSTSTCCTVASEATVQASTLHTFPMAQSDVAVVVDESVPADAVQRALRDGAGSAPRGADPVRRLPRRPGGGGPQVAGLPAHLPGARPHPDDRRGQRAARHRAAGRGRARSGRCSAHERAHRGARRRRGRGRAGAGVRGRPRRSPRRRRHRGLARHRPVRRQRPRGRRVRRRARLERGRAGHRPGGAHRVGRRGRRAARPHRRARQQRRASSTPRSTCSPPTPSSGGTPRRSTSSAPT